MPHGMDENDVIYANSEDQRCYRIKLLTERTKVDTMKDELQINKSIEGKVQMQEIFGKIEKKYGYQTEDIACIWKYIKQEMLNCFQTGASIDLGEGFGEFRTSLFMPMETYGTNREPRYQVRFKAGTKLKKQLEIWLRTR